MEAPLLNRIVGTLGVLLLLGFAPNVLLLCAPVSLPVVTAAGVCLAIGAGDHEKRQPRSTATWCCLPFAIPFAILVLGVVFNHEFWPQGTAPIALTLLQLCVAVHLLVALGMLSLVENWRTRVFLVGWSLLQGLASFCTYFVSYMSVTGDAL
jgi:hypothetical protein